MSRRDLIRAAFLSLLVPGVTPLLGMSETSGQRKSRAIDEVIAKFDADCKRRAWAEIEAFARWGQGGQRGGLRLHPGVVGRGSVSV